jgi:hypothetical protein
VVSAISGSDAYWHPFCASSRIRTLQRRRLDTAIKASSLDQKLEIQRGREKSADDFAINFLIKIKANPFSALPIMALMAATEGYRVEEGPHDEHPTALARTKDLI